ncbi:hypothetical protein NL676_003677 [Syzygium grande]|nr:hypothetical protein NL676_003677 [Syzygium grande]
MEYSRKVSLTDGASTAAGAADSRVMDFGSVCLSWLHVVLGLIRQRDFEERSNYYNYLLAAETQAISGKKGMHSSKDPPVMHITDLVTASAKKARDFLPFLQRSRRVPAMVEYVLSGRDESFSDEAIALMRRKIMQRDVEIEVETVDRTGTFLGSLCESKENMAAEQVAKRQKLKIWENYVEGQEVSNGDGNRVLGGGKFYVQTVGDQKVASIRRQVASLVLQEAPLVGAFNPRKGDTLLAQFSADNSWNRAMSFTLDPSLAFKPGLAQLCNLAYIKVPTLDEDFGQEAAVYLSELTLSSSEEFKVTVEERDTSGGKVKGHRTGIVLMEGLARMEKRKKWDSKQRQMALDNLEKD